jgi:GTPase
VPTIEQALEYMGIDYVDDMIRSNVTRAMNTAARTLRGAVGDDVLDLLPGDERATELILIYTDDLYSERGVGAKVSAATRQLVHSMEWQLKLELRRAREARA